MMSHAQPGNDQPWEVTMTAAHAPGPIVTEFNPSEWRQAVQEALDKLHITYQQLADMARRRQFDSLEAQKLWISIGEFDQ